MVATMQLASVLPEIASHILSYLPWQEKLRTCDIVPSWRPHLHSSHAWTWTNFDLSDWLEDRPLYLEVLNCLKSYGTYMQTCQAQGVNDTFLQTVYSYCPNLKTLRIHLSYTWLINRECAIRKLVAGLSNVMKHTSLQRLELCNVQYDIRDPESGAEMLLVALQESNLHSKLHKLEFSHCYDFSGILPSLQLFDQLVVLKCPIQVLTTVTIDILAKSSLQTLHLLNDGSTLNEDFIEENHINWTFLSSAHPELQVHYIVEERSLYPSNLCPNPLVRGFVMDSLCNPVSGDLILAIADHYGKTLLSFVYIALSWDFLPYEDVFEIPNMFQTFVEMCPKLQTFVCGTELPGMALLMFCNQLHELLVSRDLLVLNLDDDLDFGLELLGVPTELDSLEEAVSAAMDRPWKALEHEEFMERAGAYKTI